jgi:hypothetical protein
MPRWTPEARERQAALIREWKPWTRSTGPVTSRGKRKASKNWKQSSRAQIAAIKKMFRQALDAEPKSTD